MFKNGKSVVEGDPKKSWSGIETKGELNKKNAGLEVSLVEIH